MKIIRRVPEGEIWTSTIIGWRTHHYRNYEFGRDQYGLKVTLYIGVALIKWEFIWL